jgi:hypothetical protein
VLGAPASNTVMFFFRVIHVFLHLAVHVSLEQHETFSTLKTLICRKYSFQKNMQFSQGNNVQDDPASSTHVFLLTDT